MHSHLHAPLTCCFPPPLRLPLSPLERARQVRGGRQHVVEEDGGGVVKESGPVAVVVARKGDEVLVALRSGDGGHTEQQVRGQEWGGRRGKGYVDA